jgi:anaerobic ribonucleoside-triphosphate reductase activating protein
MNIASTQFTLKHKAFEIYLSGCDGICGKQCHNYELRDYGLGEDHKTALPTVISKIKEFDSLIENIWILGGEPLLQNQDEFSDMITKLSKLNKKLWLWTRFEFEWIKKITPKWQEFDYIKCGMYLPNMLCDDNIQYGIKLATSNQYIKEIYNE